MPALELMDVRFRYSATSPEVVAVKSLRVDRGERIFMHGPSGSGKTTLLGLVGGLFLPNAGSVLVLDNIISSISQRARDRFRAAEIGFIFQVFNLVPYLSVIENVTLPCRFGRRVSSGFKSSIDEARYLIDRLGISTKGDANVQKLSIGQQQRVAAARALIGSPGLVIADEPTSALDTDARRGFLDVLFEQAKREGSSILFVSHDRSLAGAFDRSVALTDINQAQNEGPSK